MKARKIITEKTGDERNESMNQKRLYNINIKINIQT